jgi:hypothetical protein
MVVRTVRKKEERKRKGDLRREKVERNKMILEIKQQCQKVKLFN